MLVNGKSQMECLCIGHTKPNAVIRFFPSIYLVLNGMTKFNYIMENLNERAYVMGGEYHQRKLKIVFLPEAIKTTFRNM
jgi:DeoR/GlpR family transcriptional regulator of sugar metabolism